MAFNAGARPLKLVQKTNKVPAGPTQANAHLGAKSLLSLADQLWPTLQDFLESVYSIGEHVSNHSFEELYRAIQDVVAAGQGDRLYDKLIGSIQTNTSDRMQTLLVSSAGLGQEASALMNCLATAWSNHCTQLVMVRNVFLVLDRACVRNTNRLSIYESGVDIFRDALLSQKDLFLRFIDCVNQLIQDDRRGQLVDRQLLTSITRMLAPGCGIGLYARELQPGLLRQADRYFEDEGIRSMAALDAPQYLAYVQAVLQAEHDRVHSYLDPIVSLEPLIAIVEHRLIDTHVAGLLERGLGPLVDGCRGEDLHLMYKLLKRVRRSGEMCRAFAGRTRARFIDLVSEKDEEKDKRLVASLLEYKAAMDQLVSKAFDGDDSFAAALRTSLVAGVNTRENKPAELIAKFVDSLMRGGTKSGAALAAGSPASEAGASSVATASGEELEGLLERVMVVFRAIHGKDVFEAFYKKDLAKRLLLGKSASIDLEKAMVARLKAECGSQFTVKLEGMFKDADLSKELMSQYEGSPARAALSNREAQSEIPRQPDLQVHVLTSSYWPSYSPAAASIPPDLEHCLGAFGAFYKSKYSSGRQLHWQHNLGHCLVRATFPSGRKELDVSFFQALVLVLFNDTDAISFTEIKDRTSVEDGELRRTLQSLACGQVRVLRKEPKGRDVGDTDLFLFNSEFKASLVRIKINTIQMKETKAEVEATHERVAADRQYQVDAAIVRVMKSRKTLSHQALLVELFGYLRFPMKASDIKKRIESLIERDYLERDEGDANVYRYLA